MSVKVHPVFETVWMGAVRGMAECEQTQIDQILLAICDADVAFNQPWQAVCRPKAFGLQKTVHSQLD